MYSELKKKLRVFSKGAIQPPPERTLFYISFVTRLLYINIQKSYSTRIVYLSSALHIGRPLSLSLYPFSSFNTHLLSPLLGAAAAAAVGFCWFVCWPPKGKTRMEAIAKHDFTATAEDELSFRRSQILKVYTTYNTADYQSLYIT